MSIVSPLDIILRMKNEGSLEKKEWSTPLFSSCLASPISNECLETFGASVVCFAMIQPTWPTWSKEGESSFGVRNGFSVCSARDKRGLNNGNDCRSMSDFFFIFLSSVCDVRVNH